MNEENEDYPAFAMTLVTEKTASAMTSMTVLDSGCVRNFHDFDFVVEHHFWFCRYLPWQWRFSELTGVDRTSAIRGESPGSLSFFGECLQLILKKR